MKNTIQWQTPMPSEKLSPLLAGDKYPQAKPTAEGYGYYIEIGRGMGYFSWFPDESRMLRHLAHVEVLHLPARMPERADYEALVKQLVPILETYEKNHQAEALLKGFGKIVPEIKLQWVGSVKELSNPHNAFTEQVHKHFKAEKGADWFDFLADYGI